ncbi:PREDICTED: GATA transcription factor 20-like [Camelina sativa]|uniref:GATA transcription factor 20-like n=1 Tax=Camelina sativa TaxID=90675 RepID=A0ABM0XQW7_CAMSA|nr:PREDICTED: GATA transcription factor 20-like [Camelina sativa]
MMGYQTNPSFSMFFSSENDDQNQYNYDPYNDLSSSTSVDCTLSLGTPSTRLDDHRRFSSAGSNNISGDFYFHGGNAKTASYKKGGGDHSLPRRCASCDTTSTPLWRNGPKGPKSLCNACGIRFKKEERRATARNLTIAGGGSSAAEIPVENPYNGGGSYYSHHHHYASSSPSWAHQNTQRVPYLLPAPEMEYPYVEDASAASFMSWN